MGEWLGGQVGVGLSGPGGTCPGLSPKPNPKPKPNPNPNPNLAGLEDGVVRVEVVQRLVHVLARAHRVEVDAEELGHLGEELVYARAQLHLELHVLHRQCHLGLGIRAAKPRAAPSLSARTWARARPLERSDGLAERVHQCLVQVEHQVKSSLLQVRLTSLPKVLRRPFAAGALVQVLGEVAQVRDRRGDALGRREAGDRGRAATRHLELPLPRASRERGPPALHLCRCEGALQ